MFAELNLFILKHMLNVDDVVMFGLSSHFICTLKKIHYIAFKCPTYFRSRPNDKLTCDVKVMCIYVSIYIYIYMYMYRIHVFMYVYMYVYMYAYTYVYIYIYPKILNVYVY